MENIDQSLGPCARGAVDPQRPGRCRAARSRNWTAAEFDRDDPAAAATRALETKSAAALRSLPGLLRRLAGGAAARRELLRPADCRQAGLEAEMLLWQDRQSPDLAVAGPAVAQLAELLEQAGHHEGAAACYQQLQGQFAAVVCRDGKTGKRAGRGPAPGRDARPSRSSPPRPGRRARWKPPSRPAFHRNDNGYGCVLVVQYQGDPGPFYSGADASLRSAARVRPPVYDRFGRVHWQVPLTENGEQVNVNFNGNVSNAYVQGHCGCRWTGSSLRSGRADGRRQQANGPATSNRASIRLLTAAGRAPQPVAVRRRVRIGGRLGADNGQTGTKNRLLWSEDLNDSSRDSGKKTAMRPGSAPRSARVRFQPIPVPHEPRRRDQQPLPVLPAIPKPRDRRCAHRRAAVGAARHPAGKPNLRRRPVHLRVAGAAAESIRSARGDSRCARGHGLPRKTASRWASATCRRSLIPTWDRSTTFEAGHGVMPPRPRRATSAWPRWAATSSAGAPAAKRRRRWGDSSPGKKGPRSTCSILGSSGPSGPTRKFRAGSQVALADEEAVGVMESDGHFVLLELPGGRTIADLKLEAEDLLGNLPRAQRREYLLLTKANVQEPGYAGDPSMPSRRKPGRSATRPAISFPKAGSMPSTSRGS